MNIYKRGKSGIYWYRFEYAGKQVRRSSGVTSAKDAKDIASAYRTKLARGEVGLKEPEPAPTIPTFSAALKTFLDWSETEYQAHPASHKRYVTSSKALLAFFGSKALDKITSADVEEFKTWRSRQKKAPAGKKSKHRKARTSARVIMPATVNRELALLGHLFSHFEALVPLNPCRKVRKLEERNEQDRVLTREEQARYLMACSQPLQDVATLMLELGLRPEEACRIRRENVFIDQAYLFVPFGKTASARRKLWLTDAAFNVLSRRLATIKGTHLFPGRGTEDRPIVKLNAAHTSAAKRSGVARFRLYDLRHTWATRAAQAGVDLITLQTLLGHSSLAMLKRYVHPQEEHQAEAMQKIQAYANR